MVDIVNKHYAMGRLGGHGLAVMQDGFNIYISGGHAGLFRFLADSGEFTSGELFVAVFKLQGGVTGEVTITEGDVFTIEWLSLGKTDAEKVVDITRGAEDLSFGTIFSQQEAEGGRCREGFELVRLGGGANG